MPTCTPAAVMCLCQVLSACLRVCCASQVAGLRYSACLCLLACCHVFGDRCGDLQIHAYTHANNMNRNVGIILAGWMTCEVSTLAWMCMQLLLWCRARASMVVNGQIGLSTFSTSGGSRVIKLTQLYNSAQWLSTAQVNTVAWWRHICIRCGLCMTTHAEDCSPSGSHRRQIMI